MDPHLIRRKYMIHFINIDEVANSNIRKYSENLSISIFPLWDSMRKENIPPWHFISVNRKIKYTIPTPHNFAKVDFSIKWNIVSLQIDVMT